MISDFFLVHQSHYLIKAMHNVVLSHAGAPFNDSTYDYPEAQPQEGALQMVENPAYITSTDYYI